MEKADKPNRLRLIAENLYFKLYEKGCEPQQTLEESINNTDNEPQDEEWLQIMADIIETIKDEELLESIESARDAIGRRQFGSRLGTCMK